MCHHLAEHTHCQHDPNIFSVVRHPGVPKAKVSNDDATLLNRWLAWASHSPPLLEQMLLDTPACPLTVRTDLNVKTRELSRMSSKPSRRKELLWSFSKTLEHMDAYQSSVLPFSGVNLISGTLTTNAKG